MGLPAEVAPGREAASSCRLPEWTPATGRMTGTAIEMHFDANTVRGGLNGGGGRISLAAEGYGPIALYVGGTGKVEFKDIAVGDLGLQVRQPEVTSTDFRKQTINDFYYGWGQAAADFNHDGHLDIISGPFIFYGPDFTKFREIFRGEATDPTNDFAMDSHEEFAGTLPETVGRPDHGQSLAAVPASTCMSIPREKTAPGRSIRSSTTCRAN